MTRRWSLIAAAVLLAAGFLAYFNSFSVPFMFDGTASIRDNPNIRFLWPIWETVSAAPGLTVAGRPVLAVSLALNYQISGLEVWSYHLFNLLFHILSALLLFGIIRRTLQTENLKDRFAKSANWISLAASVLWLVHPLHTNAVTYINQRAESLMGMFYLLTLYCSIRSFSADRNRLWIALACAACALGTGTKEAIATAPLLVLLYDRIFVSNSFKQLLTRHWPLYAALFATWSLLLLSILSGSRTASGLGLGWTPIQYAVTQCYVIAFIYLKLALIPHPLIFDYGSLVPVDPLSSLIPALILLALLAATILALIRRNPLGYLGAWFFLILAPTSSLMPIVSQIAVEYRMYLSLASVIILIVLAAHYILSRLFVPVTVSVTVPGRLRFATGAILCFLVASTLILLTHLRNRDYQSAITIWTDTIEKDPTNPRAHQNRGSTYGEMGRHDEAITDFTKAIEIQPNLPRAHNNRGASYHATRKFKEALKDFQKAIDLGLEDPTVYLNRGKTLLALNQPKQAIEDFNRVIQHNPAIAEAYNQRGMAAGMTGDHARAIRDFNRAIALQSNHAEAHANRGTAYVNLRDFPRALPDLERAIQLNPEDPRPHMSLAATLGHLHRAKEAVPHYREAIRLYPEHALALNNLAFILATHPDPKVRNGEEAVRLAEKACRLTKNRIYKALETLAAAYAEVGRFEEAIEVAEKAKKMAEERLKPADSTRLKVEIDLYKKKIPYRKKQ